MYLTASGPGRLFKADFDAGAAIQIGADDFGGIGETTPTGVVSHNNKLYMVGTGTDTLYEINTQTGTANAVGTAIAFNAPDGGETDPTGLASHNNNLYMTGNSQNRLYTLNTTTGEATPVGATTGFNTSENTPTGIAGGYHKPPEFTITPYTGTITYTGPAATAGDQYTLYAQTTDGRRLTDGSTSNAIDTTAPVTITITNRPPSFNTHHHTYFFVAGSDGRNTPVVLGAPPASDPEGQSLVYSLRGSDPASRMYMLGGGSDTLYALNSATSEAVRVGAAEQFGISETDPRGMAWHNGQLYMAGHKTNNLYTLNTTTGEATLVATNTQTTSSSPTATNTQTTSSSPTATGTQTTSSSGPDATGTQTTADNPASAGRPSGVASHNGELYVTTTGTGRLYRIDPDTLTVTQIGSDGFGDIDETAPVAIASHRSPGNPAKLYMVGDDNDRIYTLDTTTGEATPITATTNATDTDATGNNTNTDATSGFGAVGETEPAGLASHGNSLYMTGNTNNWLYTVDTDTGEATRVGAASGFDIGESAAHGIAVGYTAPSDFTVDAATGEISYTGASASGGARYTLYAQVSDGKAEDNTASSTVDDTAAVTVRVTNRDPSFSADSYSYTLTSGSDGSDAPVAVGTPTVVDPDDQALTYSLRADPSDRMYMAGGDNSGLYALDITTGIAELISSHMPYEVDFSDPRGMAWHNGQLYTTGYEAGSLYTLDVVTGKAALVATKAQIAGTGGAFKLLSGVASHDGDLYVTTTGTGRLYRVDLDTLTGTQIGRRRFRQHRRVPPHRHRLARYPGQLGQALHDRADHQQALQRSTLPPVPPHASARPPISASVSPARTGSPPTMTVCT